MKKSEKILTNIECEGYSKYGKRTHIFIQIGIKNFNVKMKQNIVQEVK